MREFERAAGPQRQLCAHQTGDPRPPERAEGLPPIIPTGEENNHCGLHVCHPLDPTPGLKGASGVRAERHRGELKLDQQQ